MGCFFFKFKLFPVVCSVDFMHETMFLQMLHEVLLKDFNQISVVLVSCYAICNTDQGVSVRLHANNQSQHQCK